MPDNRYRIEAVYKAGLVLKLIADAKEPIGPAEIEATLGITLNAAFRMCETLEELGWIRKIGGKYELGMGLALMWARKKAGLEAALDTTTKELSSLSIHSGGER